MVIALAGLSDRTQEIDNKETASPDYLYLGCTLTELQGQDYFDRMPIEWLQANRSFSKEAKENSTVDTEKTVRCMTIQCHFLCEAFVPSLSLKSVDSCSSSAFT